MKRKKNKPAKTKLKKTIKFGTDFHTKDGVNLSEDDISSKSLSDTYFFYRISRLEIELNNTKRLLHDLRPNLDNPMFKAGPGSVIFSVSGYDDDPRELIDIPEFRCFVKNVQKEAPCWLYFTMPGYQWINIILSAYLASVEDGNLSKTDIKNQIVKILDEQIGDCYKFGQQEGIEMTVLEKHINEIMSETLNFNFI